MTLKDVTRDPAGLPGVVMQMCTLFIFMCVHVCSCACMQGRIGHFLRAQGLLCPTFPTRRVEAFYLCSEHFRMKQNSFLPNGMEIELILKNKNEVK